MLVYALVAAAWIAVSDQLVAFLRLDPASLALAQTVKGWLFVVATGSLLGLLLRGFTGEQRRADARLQRVYRVQRTLSAANQALVRADKELPLQEAICRAAITEGGFRFAWVGYRRDD